LRLVRPLTTRNAFAAALQDNVQLLRGDLDGVAEAARWAEHAAAHDGRPWTIDANNRAQKVATAARHDPREAIEILREQVAWTRKALKIPTPSQHAEGT
jgi:hypothetical protein